MELLKQQDPRTRFATAQLIDELSEGVTLAPQRERVATEVAHFLFTRAGLSTFPLVSLVWSRLSYVLGTVHPLPLAFSPADQLTIQKAFFDHLWEVPLTDFIDELECPTGILDLHELAVRLNEGNLAHAGSIKSFAQAYRAEMCGVVSLAVPDAREVLQELHIRRTGRPCDRTPAEQEVFDLLCAEVRNGDAAFTLPTLHVGALCHAAVRWNQGRKLTGNDLYDFHHAEAAIAYCDVFLTDNPLKTLLQQHHLRISEQFACRVIAERSEAADWARGGG